MEDEIDKVLARWSVRAEDLELGEVIGAGSFGVVRAGTLKDGNVRLKVAVKQLPISDTTSANEWQKLLREAVVLAKASERCKGTCRLYGMCMMAGYFCLVMKRYVTSLHNKLNDYPDRKAPKKKVKRWMLEICQAVVELHGQNVILRDLKPANILLDEFEGAIIADFGIARIVENTIAQLQTKIQAGTPAYMAPEMFDDELGAITAKVDVWALGCLLLELQTGKVPWEGLSTVKIMTQVYGKKNSPSIPAELSREFTDMLERCFAYEATHRASSMDILEVLKGHAYSAAIPNNSIQPSSSGSNYSKFLTMDSIVLPLPPGMDGSRYCMSHLCGLTYLFWEYSNGPTMVAVYTSEKDFVVLKFPTKYDLFIFVEFIIYPVSGLNDMVYVGARRRSKGSLKGVASVLVWKKDRFLYGLTSPRQDTDSDWYYSCLRVSPSSGTLYCGCSDGIIEVWKSLYPDQPHVFTTALKGHISPVNMLTVDKYDTLYSFEVVRDRLDTEVVRVWRDQKQVAELEFEWRIDDITCTPEGKLYVITSDGLKMWCDLKFFAHSSIPRGSGIVNFGGEIFSTLCDPNGVWNITNSCLLMQGSEIVYFMSYTRDETGYLEAWLGNECLAKVDIGRDILQLWGSWDVANDGMVYYFGNNQMHRWKLV